MSLDLTLKNREFNFNVANLNGHKVYEFEDFRLDATTKLLFRDEEQLVLTPKAVETLIALVERQGTVVAKEELMREIWADTIVEESNLAQYLHILRKTLGETAEGKPYIETLKRRGYRFNGNARSVNTVESVPQAREFSQNVTNIPTKPVASYSRPVERRGNVLAVADWRMPEPVIAAERVIDQHLPSRSFSPVILVAALALFALLLFAVFQLTTIGRGSGQPSRTVAFVGSDLKRLTTTGNSKRAAIAPDGKYVAHVVGDSAGDSLMVRQVAVANDIRIAGPLQSELVWITFAPDGNFVYYLALAKDKGETELFRVPVLGGPIVKIAHDIGAPSFSPDGRQMAFMIMNQEESRLIVTSADSTNEGLLTPRNAPDYLTANETVLASRREPDYLNMFWQAPAWSPDGKHIAFPVSLSDEGGRYETVLAVDVATRTERKVSDVRWQQVGQPRWLVDGLVVTASETSTGPLQLWHVSLPDGAVSRITRDLNSYQNLSLTSNGEILAVIQNQAVSNIWTLGESMSTAKQVMSESGRFNEIIWLPDGRLAYTSNAGGSSDIWVVNADGSGNRQLTVGANARLGIAPTADGKQLVFSAERQGKYNLWRIGLDGSNQTQITKGEGEYYPQCTPDGRWIVYQSGGNYPTLWKMPVDGGDAIAITKTTASRPSLSPDGRFVAYHYLDSSFEISRWGIGVIDLEDGRRVNRFDFPSTVTERLVKWTRDGKAIAFLNSPGGVPNIWLQPLDGSDAKPLTDFASDSIISFNWNADGSSLAVIRGVETSDVLLINRNSSK